MKTQKHIQRSPIREKCEAKRAGFTLLELVLIMSLIGMVSIGVYTNLEPQQIRVDAAMLKLVHDVRYAQDRAMITGRNHGFRTISTTQYEIYDTSPGNPTLDPTTQGSMTVSLASDYPNVAFPGSYQLEFNSLGSPVIGGGGSVSLSNGTETKSFSLTSNTGLINLP